jgi:kumamolisin
MTSGHTLLERSERPWKADDGRRRKTDRQARLEIMTSLSAPELLNSGETISRVTSGGDLGTKYGAKPEDAEKVTKVGEGYGLTVEEIFLPTRSIRVSGTAEAVAATFHLELAESENTGRRQCWSGKGPLEVPEELGGIATAVFGMNERLRHRCNRK